MPPPVEPYQKVRASEVTYLQSREARELESADADAYARVYDAERPELFFKAHGWRAAGPGEAVRVRRDSRWNVPEPGLVLVLNGRMEVVGYTAGNDVSSRDIEGENPLYLPQAKVYDGSCALPASCSSALTGCETSPSGCASSGTGRSSSRAGPPPRA